MDLRPLRQGDLERAFALDADTFHQPAEGKAAFLRGNDPARWLGAFDGERLVAQTRVHPFGQFFGGRSVPMGGVAAVAVAPDRRGQGLARRVLTASLEAMRERGEVLSTLFPATTRLYRGLGWEVAGHHLWRRVPPRALAALPAPEGCATRPADAGDVEPLRACYGRVAPDVNGFVDRSDARWQRFAESLATRSAFAVLGASGEPLGYVVYHQLDGAASDLGGPFRLAVDDHVATDRDATLAIWRLLGSWASVVDAIHYRGAAEDPLLLLLPEQDLEVVAETRWMTRLVDAAGAVAARGYAPGLAVEAHLALRDPLLPHNDGRFALRVRDGAGLLERGGRGRVELDVGAFAALYTGWASPAILARAGRLRGGTAADLAALGVAFAGPTPWMLDQF